MTHVESRPKRVLLSEKQFNEIEAEAHEGARRWKSIAIGALVGWTATVLVFAFALVSHP